jgi:hypothetical protein
MGSEYDPTGKQREGILSMMSTSEKGAEQTSQTPKASFLSATPVKSVKNARLLRGFRLYRCFPVGSYSDPEK